MTATKIGNLLTGGPTGPTGPSGASGASGAPGSGGGSTTTFKGEYNPLITYVPGDVVQKEQSIFECLIGGTGTENSFWEGPTGIVASYGDSASNIAFSGEGDQFATDFATTVTTKFTGVAVRMTGAVSASVTVEIRADPLVDAIVLATGTIEYTGGDDGWYSCVLSTLMEAYAGQKMWVVVTNGADGRVVRGNGSEQDRLTWSDGTYGGSDYTVPSVGMMDIQLINEPRWASIYDGRDLALENALTKSYTKGTDLVMTSHDVLEFDADGFGLYATTGYYQFDMHLWISVASAAPGIKWNLVGSSPAEAALNYQVTAADGSVAFGNNADYSDELSATFAVATDAHIHVSGRMHITEPTSLDLAWCQQTSSADALTLRSGSSISLTRWA